MSIVRWNQILPDSSKIKNGFYKRKAKETTYRSLKVTQSLFVVS